MRLKSMQDETKTIEDENECWWRTNVGRNQAMIRQKQLRTIVILLLGFGRPRLLGKQRTCFEDESNF